MSIITSALINKRINVLDKELDYSAPIFGVYWDEGETPALTRTHDAVGMTSAVGVDGGWVQNDFDSAPIFGQIGKTTDTLGNVFVRIPKLYIRKTDGIGFRTWAVTTRPLPGFYLPSCFWDFTSNKELPYADFGAYKASLGAGNKLESKSGVYPLVITHIVNMRTYAQNNNVGGLLGYQQLDIHFTDVLTTLIFIEFATLDIQSVMKGYTEGRYSADDKAVNETTNTNTIIVSNTTGAYYKVGQAISVGTSLGGNEVFYGRTITQIQVDTPDAGKTTITFDGTPVSIAVNNILYNTGWKNGFSSGIAASSGSIVSNSDGKYPCMYRGIESPFGDIWQFVDGLNINNNRGYVCKNAANYASNVFASPYEQLGYVNGTTNNWVKENGFDPNYPFAELPTAVVDSMKYYCDYYFQNINERIALFGGNWNYRSYAGLSYWALHISSSVADVSVGGRLCRKCL